MTSENREEFLSPSRRALLKAAVAGGAFAVPLIASFSMETASAQTRASALSSSNQVIITGNMLFCSNMTTVPTAVFYAELQEASGGPVVGLAGLEFAAGRDDLYYELIVKGTLFSFTVDTPPYSLLFEDETSSKVGAIPGSAFRCPGELAEVYSVLAAGGATIQVNLTDGTALEGAIAELGLDSPLHNSFSFRQA